MGASLWGAKSPCQSRRSISGCDPGNKVHEETKALALKSSRKSLKKRNYFQLKGKEKNIFQLVALWKYRCNSKKENLYSAPAQTPKMGKSQSLPIYIQTMQLSKKYSCFPRRSSLKLLVILV